jgi:hypothetical protein
MTSLNSSRPKKARQVENKVRNMVVIFCDFKGIVHSPNFGGKRTCCCIMITHHLTSFFTRNFFWQKQHDCYPPSTLLSWLGPLWLFLFPQLKIKLKGRHFDTIDVIEQNHRWCWTPPQNTTSRMHLKNCRSTKNGAYAQKGTISKVIVASRPKVSFWPDGSISPGNYGWIW